MTLAASPTVRNWRAYLLPLAILAIALVISAVVRIRLLDAPLERDEGEHAYTAQTLLAGYAPWQLAYGLKLPGTDYVYAGVMAVFGQTATAIRIGLLLTNTATILLIAFLGRMLFGIAGGAVAGASYAVLSCSQNVLGTIAHSTHYVVFFAVIATILLLRGRDRPLLLFGSGLAFGIAFLMKQPGIIFAGVGVLYIVSRRKWSGAGLRDGIRRLAIYSLGVMLPYLLLCLALWRAGTFHRFWFWSVTLASAHATAMSPSLTLQDSALEFVSNIPAIVAPNLFIWILAVLGMATVCLDPGTRRAGLCVGALLGFSLFAACAGRIFNPHYFILMLPAIALMTGAWAATGDRIVRWSIRNMPAGSQVGATIALLCFVAACLYSISRQSDYLFRMTPYEFERSSYGVNPFPEAVNVAEYIRTHSDDGARIAVLGSEAEIYFYAHRQAATGYMFTYDLMGLSHEALAGQHEMIAEIESARPEYIVYAGVATSWLRKPQSATTLFSWANDYTHRLYDVVGVVDIMRSDPPRYVWGLEAATYSPMASSYLILYRRH